MFCVENNFKSSIRALTIPATFLFYIAQQEGGFAAKTKEEYERLLVQAVLFSVRFHCIHTEFFTEFQAVAVSVITYLPFLTRRKLTCTPVARVNHYTSSLSVGE